MVIVSPFFNGYVTLLDVLFVSLDFVSKYSPFRVLRVMEHFVGALHRFSFAACDSSLLADEANL